MDVNRKDWQEPSVKMAEWQTKNEEAMYFWSFEWMGKRIINMSCDLAFNSHIILFYGNLLLRYDEQRELDLENKYLNEAGDNLETTSSMSIL